MENHENEYGTQAKEVVGQDRAGQIALFRDGSQALAECDGVGQHPTSSQADGGQNQQQRQPIEAVLAAWRSAALAAAHQRPDHADQSCGHDDTDQPTHRIGLGGHPSIVGTDRIQHGCR